MKHFFSKLISVTLCIILLPILCTLFLQGVGKNTIKNNGIELPELPAESDKEQVGFDESILIGMLANQIPINTESEAKKAQAVIARTNCLKAIQNNEELPVSLTEEEMLRLWGRDNFSLYYSQLKECIEATRGEVMIYKGEYIQADFHAVSAGYTRDAAEVYKNQNYPYLQKADSRMDIVAEDFLKVTFYTPEEFVVNGKELFTEESKNLTAAQILEQIQITKTDSSGYVLEITIGDKTYSGEEIRLMYNWHSAAFFLKEMDGQIRVVTKGYGHGLGASLYGMRALAAEGSSYQEILEYFYKEISFANIYD